MITYKPMANHNLGRVAEDFLHFLLHLFGECCGGFYGALMMSYKASVRPIWQILLE